MPCSSPPQSPVKLLRQRRCVDLTPQPGAQRSASADAYRSAFAARLVLRMNCGMKVLLPSPDECADLLVPSLSLLLPPAAFEHAELQGTF